jgi:1-acyl-sn-glycerol-3-phosphate acyltransferase
MWMDIETVNKEIAWETHPAIVISNHQHNFDILIGDKFFDDKFAVIGKKQLGYIPLFGQLFALAGNILLDRSEKQKALDSLNKMLNTVIKKGLSLLIFPEGTRNTSQKLADFKKGAFHMAKQAKIPILVVSVSHYYPYIEKFKKLKIKVIVNSPIPASRVESMEIQELMDYSKSIMNLGIIKANKVYS